LDIEITGILVLNYVPFFYTLKTYFHHANRATLCYFLLLVPHKRAVLFCACLKQTKLKIRKLEPPHLSGFFYTHHGRLNPPIFKKQGIQP